MNRQKELYRQEDLEMMSSQQLDEVLCAELGKECADRNVVLGILEILESREQDMPLPEHSKVTEAKALYRGWDEGASFEREDKRKKNRWIANAAVIALVLLVFSTMAPKALGAANIFDLFARWTESIFAFFSPEATEAAPYEAHYVFQTDNPGLQELYDTVTELGITQRVVPQCLPAGYELKDLEVDETQNRAKIHACFTNGSHEIIITIRELLDAPKFSYFKDETDVELHEYGGVLHYIMKNESATNIVWYVDNTECQLRVVEEDIYRIIRSVHNEE